MASLPSSPSPTLHYKTCTKQFPVLLCTTKLAQSTSQYYVVLQSLHKALPSTTLYYKACAKHFPVLRCTTKLAQSTSQHYFVLQSLHKALPSTTLYYKACTKHFPVLLCTTKLSQSTSQYYVVLQSLHKALPSTTLYYKACTKHFPVLLCTTKLSQSTSQYYFALTTHAYIDGTMELFSDLSMAVCWDFWSEINSIWSIFVVLRLCCPVVVTVTRKGNIRIYNIYIYITLYYGVNHQWFIVRHSSIHLGFHGVKTYDTHHFPGQITNLRAWHSRGFCLHTCR